MSTLPEDALEEVVVPDPPPIMPIEPDEFVVEETEFDPTEILLSVLPPLVIDPLPLFRFNADAMSFLLLELAVEVVAAVVPVALFADNATPLPVMFAREVLVDVSLAAEELPTETADPVLAEVPVTADPFIKFVTLEPSELVAVAPAFGNTAILLLPFVVVRVVPTPSNIPALIKFVPARTLFPPIEREAAELFVFVPSLWEPAEFTLRFPPEEAVAIPAFVFPEKLAPMELSMSIARLPVLGVCFLRCIDVIMFEHSRISITIATFFIVISFKEGIYSCFVARFFSYG